MGGTTRPCRGTSPGVPRVPFITRRGCRVGGPSRRPNAALDSYNEPELTGALRLTYPLARANRIEQFSWVLETQAQPLYQARLFKLKSVFKH